MKAGFSGITLRATLFMRRSQRNIDHYQTEENLHGLLEKMQNAVYPQGVLFDDFKKLLYAIQYAARRKPLKESKSGRKARFDDAFLQSSSNKIKSVLQNETGGRISLLRFVSTYLPLLEYPKDIKAALNLYRINLEEARSLARINSKNLGTTAKKKPSDIRKELLNSHLKRKDTQSGLARKIVEKIRLTPKAQAAAATALVLSLEEKTDELLEFSEFDTEHLLWEEIKSFIYLAREIDTNLIDDFALHDILKNLDNLKLSLLKFRRRVD